MIFDTSGLERAFKRMEDGAKKSGKTLAEKQGAVFLGTLKKESWKIAPSRETLTAVAERLKGRLKRKKGVTPAKELARRIRARGTFARGWAITKIESSGFRIRIWMEDSSADSAKVDSLKGVSNKSAEITGKSYKERLDKYASQVAGIFK